MPADPPQSRDEQPLPSVPPAPEGVELAPGVRAPESTIRFQFGRSGGPGGQNVKKVNTKAELWGRLDGIKGLSPRAVARLRDLACRRVTDAGEIHLSAETERRQQANRAAALERLRELIVAAQREPKGRRKTPPSRAAQQGRLESNRRRSDIKSKRRSGSGEW